MAEPNTPAPPSNAQEQPGVLAKCWRGVKNFFKGAIAAAPTTILYSGLAFAGSAALCHFTGGAGVGMDPLGVSGNSMQQLATRMFGSLIIGGSISGAINTYTKWNEPDNAPAAQPQQTSQNTGGRARNAEVAQNQSLRPSFTPTNTRSQESARA